ncbi:MAG: AarF/ABC1/UbiB kinase family protein [Alphaproteobacteria bacterium]|nr:AarF/ABC1/UbiB kinase family protein [Alphaproteobacteria bacterium]
MSDRPKRPPKGRVARLARLGGLSGKLSGQWLGHRVADTFRGAQERATARARLQKESAAQMAETLGTLKGAAMKVGQQVALAARNLDLPEDVQAALDRVHDQAEPVPFDEIVADIESELGRPLAQSFSHVEPTPLGTASLGQAHAALLPDGRPVVVKVLHRGIETSVASDLAAIKAMFVGSRVLRRDRAELDAMFGEIRERLEEELDYLQEAANIEAFRAVYGADPRVALPVVHPSHSTERLLTMDRVPGVPLAAFVETASPAARQRAGRTLGQLVHEQVFLHRMLHADPHPGNFLFSPDGTVGLLDFGCVKHLDEYWIATYAHAGLALLDDDRAAYLQACRDMGSWVGDDPDAGELLWALGREIGVPFRTPGYTAGGPDDRLWERMQPIGRRMLLFPEIRGVPAQVMLHRTIGGVYAMLRDLKASTDWGAMLRPTALAAIARAEGRPVSAVCLHEER